jgi:hypothetical protein
MLDYVYQVCVGEKEPLAVEEFCLPFRFSYWIVVAVSHSWEEVSVSPFTYLGHLPDVSSIFSLM